MNLIKLMKRYPGHLVRHDFSKVRDYVVMVMEEVMADGYRTSVGKVSLEYKDANRTNLTIVVVVRNSDGTNTIYTASQDFYSFINVPCFISDALIHNHHYEVVLSLDDMRTIYQDRIMEINTSDKTLERIVSDRLHRMGMHGCNVTAEISDVGIYYKVEVFEDSRPSTPVLTLLTLPVNGIENEDRERLGTVHNAQIYISGV